jgi:hypothetical protein
VAWRLTTCTKRGLRAADLIAWVLYCIGLVLVAIALLMVPADAGRTLLLWIGGVPALTIGIVLKLKVMQAVRGREELDKYGRAFE